MARTREEAANFTMGLSFFLQEKFYNFYNYLFKPTNNPNIFIAINSDIGEISNDSAAAPPADQMPGVLSSYSHLYALIIGIEKYAQKRLKGCVADADEVEEYLTKDLRVPEDQIISLRDEKASRKAILDAFIHLQTDSRIRINDPIFIYFSGHGTELPVPKGWEAGGPHAKIQAIVPQDCNPEIYQNVTYPIPDRTIGALINGIAQNKGNNITVVLDCCYSGSGTRDDDDGNIIERAVEYPDNVLLPADLDQESWRESGDHGHAATSGPRHKGLDSHMLLAACSATEYAREDGIPSSRGRFTKAFIELLRREGVDKISYSDVLKRMDKIPHQNPQCEGTHSDRALFTTQSPPARRFTYPIRYEGGVWEMDAGTAHGFSAGAHFDVYMDDSTILTSSPLGTLVIDGILDFTSTMKFSPGSSTFEAVGNSTVALQTTVGGMEDLAMHVDRKFISAFVLISVTVEMLTAGPNSVYIALVEQDKAKLELVMEGPLLRFNILDKRVTALHNDIMRIPFHVEPKPSAVRPVLRAAAHYYWHLDRHSEKDGYFQSKIGVEFFELQESSTELDEAGYFALEPGPHQLCNGNVIDLTVKPNAEYGMKITNNTRWDLYPGVFYFETDDLSIVPYYLMSNSGKYSVDSPLKKNGGTLTIGYGCTGTEPRAYKLDDGQDVDIGFLKMFFATEYVNFSHIPQKTPFSEGKGDAGPSKRKQDTWGTILIPLVQRRGK